MKIKYISGLILAMTLVFVACQPEEFGESDLELNATPSEEQMEFTITQGEDAYHYVLENLTPVKGIHTVSWEFGNGGTAKGDKVIAYYPLPGEFEVALTITANDGNSTTITQNVVQTETDYAFLESPMLTMISGGVAAAEGKTWVIDSTSSGHFGIGPADGTGLEWWAADPLTKTNSGAYDDEFVFTLVGFDFQYNNNGDSYVKDFQKDNEHYSNATPLYGELDCRVNFTPAPATWSFSEEDGVNYITLSSAKPVFFGFDYGSSDNKYKIDEVTENSIHMSCIGGDGNRWYIKLIPKGYVKPTVTYSVDIAATAEENTWLLSLMDVVIPEGLSVSGYTVDFGDGSEVVEVNGYTGTAEHTYMRKGNYPVTITLMASNEDVVTNEYILVENHHSNYVPFLLDYMVMYVDNSEVEMAPVAGEDCDVSVVENPDRIYPNKGLNVFHYRKEGQEWANANMTLPAGYRFDLTTNSVFKIMVRGKAGQQVLMKLENTDKAEAWKTGTYDLIYTIQADDTWEVAEYDFAGVGAGWDWTGEQFTSDVTTDPNFNQGFYNIIRIMCNPGVGDGVHEFYFDDLAGPHVEGLKSAKL
ncbi:PKD domain-containing protein [Saccharicrinis carchari]|uniref:PKD domain-containing protein n=1 Tax=Saccharicrinis carchari TaxID=1168039 RepID=A0A521BA00_SACCC|nr:PKD domain-containing protein [Saccharicrinis carchari]SMO43934.1 PKD domain-containing protein [Saccharicrinis carchari]